MPTLEIERSASENVISTQKRKLIWIQLKVCVLAPEEKSKYPNWWKIKYEISFSPAA